MTARAFWPSEPDLKAGAGGGLTGSTSVSSAFGLALPRTSSAAAFATAGRGPMRWSSVSWAWSRPARSMRSIGGRRSTWPGSGSASVSFISWYRNLPRTRDESSALAGVLVATAFAVSVYGLYQLTVELPSYPGGIPDGIRRRSWVAWASSGVDAEKSCSRTDCSIPTSSGRRSPWRIHWRAISSVRWCSPWPWRSKVWCAGTNRGRRGRHRPGGPTHRRARHLPDADQEPERLAGAVRGNGPSGLAGALRIVGCRRTFRPLVWRASRRVARGRGTD